jgi:putative hemolysin
MDLILQLLVILIFLAAEGLLSRAPSWRWSIPTRSTCAIEARLGERRCAKLVLNLFRTPDVMLGTTLVGTNIATVTITTMGTLIFVHGSSATPATWSRCWCSPRSC